MTKCIDILSQEQNKDETKIDLYKAKRDNHLYYLGKYEYKKKPQPNLNRNLVEESSDEPDEIDYELNQISLMVDKFNDEMSSISEFSFFAFVLF